MHILELYWPFLDCVHLHKILFDLRKWVEKAKKERSANGDMFYNIRAKVCIEILGMDLRYYLEGPNGERIDGTDGNLSVAASLPIQ